MTRAPLGYGCAPLMARMSRRESVALLDAAFDAGITHFDVARSYGYGEAESAVGDFLARHRGDVTVTTKLGIEPPAASRRFRAAKAVVRRLGPLTDVVRGAARRRAEAMQQGGSFDVGQARASLETSLAELRTDRVDFLLLHECELPDLTDELYAFLTERRDAGVVGSFGVATRQEPTRQVLRDASRFAPVVQAEDSVVTPLRLADGPLEGRVLFTHSAMSSSLEEIQRHLAADSARVAAWSAATGADCTDRGQLAALLLGWARAAGGGRTVLFSSRSPARIRAGADAPAPSAEALEAFEALVAAEVRS